MTTKLSAPQQKVITYVTKHGTADASKLKALGLDPRACNNLAHLKLLVLKDGAYQLPTTATPAKSETNTKVKKGKASAKTKAAKPSKEVGATAKQPKKDIELHPCTCGCESPTKARFLPGHDARLHSVVLKVSRGQMPKSAIPGAARTREYLKHAPWMTEEIKASCGLD